MKSAVLIVRVLVGLLFIISGLVKANDPLGLSFKMQEFFEIWTGGLTASGFFLKNFLISIFSFLHEHSLTLSITMITLEIIAGIALLIGWKKRFVLNLLLILIIFFTFLTAYAYWSGKFRDCGCFGDCLPITPLSSFLKDIALLIAILFLIRFKKYIEPFMIKRVQNITLIVTLLLSLVFQWYVLTYLPVVDCLPFKKGKNVMQQMQPPPNSVPDSFAIRFVYEKGGKQFEFSPESLPADLETYTYKDRVDKLVRKGNAEPPLKGFTLIANNNSDSTQAILTRPGYTVLYFTSAEDEAEDKTSLNEFFKKVSGKNIPVYAVTNRVDRVQNFFKNMNWSFPIMKTDITAFRTAARANPTFYLLQNGTIIKKWTLPQIENASDHITNLK